MNLQERIQKSIIRIFKAIFTNTANHYYTLFGGTSDILTILNTKVKNNQ